LFAGDSEQGMVEICQVIKPEPKNTGEHPKNGIYLGISPGVPGTFSGGRVRKEGMRCEKN